MMRPNFVDLAQIEEEKKHKLATAQYMKPATHNSLQ